MLVYLKNVGRYSIAREIWYRKEAVIWLAGLLLLAFTNPGEHHHTLCPLDNLGWSFCPGCGIGRSIAYFFRLEFVQSFTTHPLGIPAVVILLHRIVQVIRKPTINT